MKKNLLAKKFTAVVIAASLVASAASCSSNGKKEETTAAETTTEAATEETTTAESSEETTTESVAETTTETTEETTAETSDESNSAGENPEVDEYSDPEVRKWAQWYLDEGYMIRTIGDESFFGPHSDMVEGFAAGTEDDNILTLDFVMKFPDYDSVDAYLNRVDEGKRGPVVRTANGDGSYEIDIFNGIWTGTLSANNVLRLVCTKR
jgi:uncharacterized cupredoxin-like copper-binding protein